MSRKKWEPVSDKDMRHSISIERVPIPTERGALYELEYAWT